MQCRGCSWSRLLDKRSDTSQHEDRSKKLTVRERRRKLRNRKSGGGQDVAAKGSRHGRKGAASYGPEHSGTRRINAPASTLQFSAVEASHVDGNCARTRAGFQAAFGNRNGCAVICEPGGGRDSRRSSSTADDQLRQGRKHNALTW